MPLPVVYTSGSDGEDEDTIFSRFGLEVPCRGQAACWGCASLSGLAAVLLFLTSFKGLHATKLALTRNSATGVVNYGTTYHGGRNLIGFWNGYMEFPATLQSIEWLDADTRAEATTFRDLSPLKVRTRDGLMVRLGLAAQYLIVQEHLADIYRTFKQDIEGFFVSNLRSSIQETVSNFTATDLYENRARVADELLAMCHRICSENLHGYLKCWRLDLLDVDLDVKIEAQNIREQIEKQKQQTEMMIQNASLVRAGTEVLESDFDRQITVVKAIAKAQAFNISAQARSNADFAQQEARAKALQTIQLTVTDGTSRLDSEQLLTYLEKLAMIESPGGPMLYGDFDSASVLMRQTEM